MIYSEEVLPLSLLRRVLLPLRRMGGVDGLTATLFTLLVLASMLLTGMRVACVKSAGAIPKQTYK